MVGTSVTLDGDPLAYVPGSLSIESEYGARTTASLDVADEDGTEDYEALAGAEAFIIDEGTGEVAFGGVLTRPSWDLILGNNAIAWSLGFTDFSVLADRAHVFDYYEAATHPLTSDIVRDILTNYLAQFGVTEGVIEDGSVVSEVTFNGQKAATALNELASRDAYAWRIDHQKKLYYQALRSYLAPWNVTPASGRWVRMRGSKDLADYVNRAFVRGPANGISDLRTETFVGDSVLKEFKLLYRPLSNVSVKVNNVAKTVGIRGATSGQDWYWTSDSDLITQDAAGTTLTSSDTLAVTYRGAVSLFVEIEDKDSIAARAAAEGTSGVYEAYYDDSNAIYLDLAIQAAETHVRQNPFDKRDLDFVTDSPGLKAGMVQNIQVPRRSIAQDYFLTSVTATDLGSADGRLRYTVKAVNGERAEDWVEWYRKIAGRKDLTVRENEIVSKCVKLGASCICSDQVSVVVRPQWIWGTSTWNGGDAWW